MNWPESEPVMQERLVDREDGDKDHYPDYLDGQFVIEKHATTEGRWAVFEKCRAKNGVWGMKDIGKKEGFHSVDDAKEWVKARPKLPTELLVEVETDGKRQCVVRSRPAVAPQPASPIGDKLAWPSPRS
jgi:hypothetical protein